MSQDFPSSPRESFSLSPIQKADKKEELNTHTRLLTGEQDRNTYEKPTKP